MKAFDGFFLPTHVQRDVADWGCLRTGDLEVRYPILTRDQVDAIWRHIGDNRDRVLAKIPVNRIAAAIDTAASVLRANIDQTTALVRAASGYSAEVVAETLAHMLDDWSAPSLQRLLAAEFADPRVLDHAIADRNVPGREIAAFGYRNAFHVFSGNVPGVAVTSLIRSLLVKSATLAKTASNEPVLPILFARAVAQVAPDIAGCIALSYWPHDSESQTAALVRADLVVVYGGEDAVASVQASAPRDAHMVVHGPRVSFGIVGPQAREDVPRAVANAVAAYDQQGCVSPHVVYVVGDRERALGFARDVAHALQALSETLPRGVISHAEAVAIRNARTAAEFADGSEVLGADQDPFTVIYRPTPDFEVSCLNRVLYVKPITAAVDVLRVLPPARLLQSAALEGFTGEEMAALARALGQAGISRITSFDRLPWPPMHWHHDGSAPLRELVRWQSVEGQG